MSKDIMTIYSKIKLISVYTFSFLIPIALGLLYIKTFGVNIIFWDQFELVPLIEKLYNGTLSINDLFSQHNEHRIFFPKIIMLLLVKITMYNTIIEMYISWIFAVSTLLIIFRLYIQNFGSSESMIWKFAPIAWIIFSFRQFENILWGWQLQIYLSLLGFVSSIYLLDKSKKIDKSFVGSILCGIISTFSFFNGLFVWPIGIIFIICSKRDNRKVLAKIWTIFWIIIWGIYFYGWTRPSYHPSPLSIFKDIFTSLSFFIMNIGSPFASDRINAFGIGILLFILFIFVILLTIYKKLIYENMVWISFILFSLMSSIVITIGRVGLGLDMALSSRYVTLTSLGIIGLYMMIINFKKNINNSQNYNILYGIILSMILIGLFSGYVSGVITGNDLLVSRKNNVESLINYKLTEDENLKKIYPNPDIARERAKILDKYRLNVFAKIYK